MATTDGKGRQFWVVAAERSEAGRFIVEADQELPAFFDSNPQFLPYSLEGSNSVIAPFGNSSFNKILAPVALVST